MEDDQPVIDDPYHGYDSEDSLGPGVPPWGPAKGPANSLAAAIYHMEDELADDDLALSDREYENEVPPVFWEGPPESIPAQLAFETVVDWERVSQVSGMTGASWERASQMSGFTEVSWKQVNDSDLTLAPDDDVMVSSPGPATGGGLPESGSVETPLSAAAPAVMPPPAAVPVRQPAPTQWADVVDSDREAEQ